MNNINSACKPLSSGNAPNTLPSNTVKVLPKLTSCNLTKGNFLIDDLNYEIAKELAESFSFKALKSFVESIKHHSQLKVDFKELNLLFTHLTTFKNSTTRNPIDKQNKALKFIQNITSVDSSTNGLLYSIKKKITEIIFATYSYFSDDPIQFKLLPKTDIDMAYLFEGLSCYRYYIETNHISALSKLLDTFTIEDKKEIYLARNSNGETFFHKTSWRNDKELIFELLTKFKDKKKVLLTKDYNGRTLLHIAAKKGNKDLIIELLNKIENKKEVLLAKDYIGQTLLHSAVWTDNTSLIVDAINKLSDEDKKEILLAKNNDGDTIFHIASCKGNTKLIAEVLKEVSNKNKKEILLAKDNNGNTIFYTNK